MAEVQGQILENGKSAGIIAADVVDGVRGKRDRATSLATPLLKVAVDRAHLGKPELDRLLEKFWASAGGRRAQLHRSVEEQLVAGYLVEAGIAPEAQVATAEHEMEERSSGGDPVRLLSILVDSGAIDENAARQTVSEVQKSWRFCKYCLSSWKGDHGDGNGNGSSEAACGVCGRPLTVAARSYEIVKLRTIAEDAPVKGVQTASEAAAGKGGPKKAAVPPPEVGETLAGVKLTQKIDDEGRGSIWKGELAADRTPRAVKVWRLGKDLTLDDIARFETAALSATKLDHPGILKVFEAGEDRGRHFVVSEWVEGRSLKRIVAGKGPIPHEKAVPLLKAALEALEASHREKLLHKNVSPGNIISVDAGGVKIADFGVCKDYGVSLDTVRGNVIGSPDFLAPEQCQGMKSDERTDLFSLGASFYFALSGKKPFEGDSTVTLIVKRLTSDARPIREVAPKVPKELADVIAKLMARKPEERYGSAREVLVALQRWEARVEAGIAATDDSGPWKKIALIGALVLVMAGVAVGVISALSNYGGGASPALLALIADANSLAERGLLVEGMEKLAPEARAESPKAEAAAALDAIALKALSRANALVDQKDYPAALRLLRNARKAITGVGVGTEPKLTEAESEIETKRTAYDDAAKADYEKTLNKAKTSTDETALKAWRAHRGAFPNQPMDDAARLAEEALSSKTRQVDLVDQAEKLAGTGKPEEARKALADAIALGQLPESQEPRKRRIERLIEFATHMAEGDRLLSIGEIELAVKEYTHAGEIIPDRSEPEQGRARAHFESILKKAREAVKNGNLKGAVQHYQDAEEAGKRARVDTTEVMKAKDAAKKAYADATRAEKTRNEKVAEGDRLFKDGEFRGSLKAYRQAENAGGAGTAQVMDGLARAIGALGSDDDEKAFGEAKKKAARATQDNAREAAWREYLLLYPEGNSAAQAKEELAKLGRPIVPGGQAVTGPPALARTERGDYLNPTDGSIMVKVPGGKFKRGTSPDDQKALATTWRVDVKEFADEGPVREVHVDDFFMDVNEVTNADYRLFLDAIKADENIIPRVRHESQPSEKRDFLPKYWNDAKMVGWTQPELPVVGVDWWDAWAYARWAGKRLPTEAEWEKAARGTDGRVYPWGFLPSPFAANVAEAFIGRRFSDKTDWKAAFFDKAPWRTVVMTSAQSCFGDDVSPYGVRHLCGNVWEWCEDWYHPDAVAKSGDKNPIMDKMGTLKQRVTRGGSWFDPQYQCRVAARKGADPQDQSKGRTFTLGFRCVRSADSSGVK